MPWFAPLRMPIKNWFIEAEGSPPMQFTLGSLADFLGGELRGEPSRVISEVATVEQAGPNDLAFWDGEKHVHALDVCCAAAIVVGRNFVESPIGLAKIEKMTQVRQDAQRPAHSWLIVDDPQTSFVKAMLQFRPPRPRQIIGISPAATIHPTAQLGEGCNIHPGVHIGEDVIFGKNCDIFPGVVIGAGCRFGDQVVIHPNAVLYADMRVGSRVIIHANAVIGADGFGYRFEKNHFERIPHAGTVILGDDVEIGACTTIDRAMVGATVIGEGTKLDNLVMIGHNCEVGKHNAFAGQVGLAGSVTTGDYVRCAGQVGIADHSRVGTGATAGAKAGIVGRVANGQHVLGMPAGPEKDQLRMMMTLPQVPKMREKLKELEKAVAQLQSQLAALQETPSQQPHPHQQRAA